MSTQFYCRNCKAKWTQEKAGSCPKCSGTRLTMFSHESGRWVDFPVIGNSTSFTSDSNSAKTDSAPVSGIEESIYACQTCAFHWRSAEAEPCPRCGNCDLTQYLSAGNRSIHAQAKSREKVTSSPFAQESPNDPVTMLHVSDMHVGKRDHKADASDLNQSRKQFLLSLARLGARSLPVSWSTHLLIYPYLLFERGDDLSLSVYDESYVKLTHDIKSRIERRIREVRADFTGIDERFGPNLLYLIFKNQTMTLDQAVTSYLRSIATDHLDIAPQSELESARAHVNDEIYRWLRRNAIPFSLRPPITIPSTKLTTLLQPFKGLPDFHLGNDIPSQKLANATNATVIPDDEVITALIDCTFFGSASDCVLFGSRAIYFNNGGISNFLPYSEFPDVVFQPQSDSEIVYDHGKVSLDGCSFSAYRLTEAFGIIKQETIRLETSGDAKAEKGLSTLPGMSELKQMLLEEVIEPLRDPERFKRYKIDIPNGILMYGPPGCGKTFIAQRLASELNYNFYEISPSAVASSYVHGSTSMIKSVFEEAAKNAPALMFVDEFEGMVPARRTLGGEQQFKAEEVNEWLVQIGSCSQRKILFVAATNEPWSIDDAVQRSGRLDKKIYVGPPDCEALGEMLLHHLEGRPFTSAQDVRHFASTIAEQGYSASDLKLLVDEAAKIAMKADQDISSSHLTTAAAERVPPSISHEQEELYLAFKEQRKVGV